MKTLFTLASVVALGGIASACSSASSGGGTLPAGQVQVDGPNAMPPPNGPMPVKAPPPPSESGGPGCPSSREPANAALSGAADVRAQLVGIYRTCLGGDSGLEVRLDPDSDLRLLWWALDDRFVRLPAGTATSGSMVIGECDGAVCMITWHSEGLDDFDPERELTVWSDPTAISVKSTSTWSEWVRLAN